MPGIVGLITKLPRDWAEPQVGRMVEALRHESCYTSGTWIDESMGVYVGWVARKNSFSDGMPLSNERGDVVLNFSGEEYPEPGTVQHLKERGHGPALDGSSYLVHAYEEDPKFPERLNGRFHGLLADRTRGTAILFNDRYGLHRIYYYESKEAFYFAAEAKAILAVCPEQRASDLRGLGEKLRAKQACGRFRGFERSQMAKYLAAIVSRHPDRGNLSGPLIHVEIGGTVDARASVGKVNGSLRVIRKT